MLTTGERAFVAAARRAVLATLRASGRPRLVPICFVLGDDDEDGRLPLYSPLDEKPKRSADPRQLARVADILERPEVEVLVDHWSEDWADLGWLRLSGLARVMEQGDDPAERETAIAALRAKYPQYLDHDLASRPLIRIAIDHVTRWGVVEPRG
jgi:PPOX class probable F420-dependent enzyme